MTKAELVKKTKEEPLEFLRRYYPAGKVEGDEYVFGNLSGEKGKSFKFNLQKQAWADFATDDSGAGIVSLLARTWGMEWKDALEELYQKEWGVQINARPAREKLPPALERPGAKYHTYRDGAGHPVLYVQRIDKADGKIFIPWTWDRKEKEWVKKNIPKDRPLFNIQTVIKKRQVLVVEGEKAAEAAMKWIPRQMAVTTWASGAKAVRKTSWGLFKGKDAVLWPDNDEAGEEAMTEVEDVLKDVGIKRIRRLRVSDLEPKADAADIKFKNGTAFATWAKSRATEVWVSPEVSSPEVLPKEEAPSNVVSKHLKNSSGDGRVQLEKWKLTLGKGGKPHESYNNIFRIIENGYSQNFWFDEYRGQYMCNIKNEGPRELTKHKVNHFLGILQEFMPGLKASVVREAIESYSSEMNKRNSGIEWLESLTWDGERRIDRLLVDYCGAKNIPYTRDVGKNIMVAMVARIFKPGSKMDNIPILEGPQGVKKSSFLEALATEELFASEVNLAGDDLILKCEGKMIIELAEMTTLAMEKTDRLKGMASTRKDVLRRKYDKDISEVRRTAIWIGTTNRDTYLKDDTGNRRYWPVKVTKAETKKVAEDREQLFAEAVVRYKKGETWWEVDEKSARIEQQRRMMVDPWENIVQRFLENEQRMGRTMVTVAAIGTRALVMDPRDLNEHKALRIERILTKLKYEKTMDINGTVQFQWGANESE